MIFLLKWSKGAFEGVDIFEAHQYSDLWFAPFVMEINRSYLKNKSTVIARSGATKSQRDPIQRDNLLKNGDCFVPIRNIGTRNDIHRGF